MLRSRRYMLGEEEEDWPRLVERVRMSPVPEQSPALAELYAQAVRTGSRVLQRKFRGRLNHADIEDIVIDKFTRVLPAIIAAANPGGFFITSVVHAAIDHCKRRETQAKHAPKIAQMQPLDARTDEVPVETFAMRRCFEQFSDRDQQILRAVAEGEDREHIARLFGTSRANVDQLVSRARKRWERFQ